MKTNYEQMKHAIEDATSILITFNRAWPGDAVASALALRLWLLQLGKKVAIAAEKPSSAASFSFLPGFSHISSELDNLRKFIISLDITNTKVSEIEYKVEDNKLDFIISPKKGFFAHEDISSRASGFAYDLIICLSTPDFESLGWIYDQDTQFFFETTVVNIDHHAANDNFGQINIVNLNTVACSEIIYNFLQENKVALNADIATCLLAGLISETKSFKTANVTPTTLNMASDLVSLGGRREEIINVLYRSRQLNVLKLWGMILTNLQSRLENRLIWSSVKSEDFITTETKPEQISDVVDELIVSLPQANIIILGYEKQDENGVIKSEAIIHSVKNFDALFLAQPFKATGSAHEARVMLNGNLEQDLSKLIAAVEEKVRRLET